MRFAHPARRLFKPPCIRAWAPLVRTSCPADPPLRQQVALARALALLLPQLPRPPQWKLYWQLLLLVPPQFKNC